MQSPIHKDTVVHFITYLNTKSVSQVNVFRTKLDVVNDRLS